MKSFLILLLLSTQVFAVEIPAESTPEPSSNDETSIRGRIMGFAMDLGLIEEEGNTDYLNDDAVERALGEALNTLSRPSYGMRGQAICLADPAAARGASDAVKGARLLMATMYQSCEAPNITASNALTSTTSPITGRPRSILNRTRHNRYLRFNPYLANRTSVRNGCFNVLEQPPIYGFGAKPIVSGNEINLHRNQAVRPICGGGQGKSGVACDSQPASAIDCSGFVTSAFRRMGLKMTPRQEFHPGMVGTLGLNQKANEANSCLDFVDVDRTISIVPGDIINIGSNHVIMVDEIGEDPLGLKKHARDNTCRRLTKSDFDFKFMHSGAAGHLGVARLDASHPNMQGFMGTLEVKARQVCNQIRNGSVATLAKSSSNGLSVMRHAGDSKPGCKGEPEVFENEGCVSGCGIL